MLFRSSSAINPSYTYPDTGTYQVTLIAYSTFNPNCADTTVGTVTLLPPYTVDFGYSLNTCSYLVSFNDSSNTASGTTSQWSWNFGDGSAVSTQQDPNHTFPGPGTYQVTFTGTSALGCHKTITRNVTIPPFVSLTTSSSTVSCYGQCNGIGVAVASNGVPPYNFIWNDPSNQSVPIATGLCAGNYSVIVTDALGCTSTAQVTINTPAPLTSSINATDAYCNGQ